MESGLPFRVGPSEGSPVAGVAGTRLLAQTGHDDGYALIDSIFPPDDTPPPDHIHRTMDEGFYILDGEFDIRVGDRVVKSFAGDYVSVPRSVEHTIRNAGSSSGRALILFVPGKGAAMLEEIFDAALSDKTGVERIAAIFAKYETEIVPSLPDWS